MVSVPRKITRIQERLMKIASALIVAGTLVAALPQQGSAQAVKTESVARYLWQPSMNVFRRFAVDRAKMITFYGDVLGLKPLPTLQLGRGGNGGNQMTRFQVGTSEIKLTGVTQNGKYTSGPVREVTGLRVLTFFFPDEAVLKGRFAQHGFATPEFRSAGGGTRVAMVQDPDGQYTELVIMPAGTPAAAFDRLEVGITVSDLDKSRAFYREFIGLDELKPVEDALLQTTKYSYRHGTTTINLWTFGTGLPANTASAGIQYVTSNVDAVDAQAKSRGVQIDQPLSQAFTALRTVWLSDPDGVTNYFAETTQSRAARDPATR
jgi:catechol 2,3-dioxygenase-like lactoylglutathione lyase family enzyme